MNFHIQVDCLRWSLTPDSGVTLENVWSEAGVVPFTKKCLMTKKVHHDVTDKDYPIFQDIQSQNNFSSTQLIIMGYKGDALLKSQFTENKIWERQAATTVTVPQTCECQDAIAATNTSMSPQTNMFKAAEINMQTEEAVEMENGKHSQVEYHLRRKAALPIPERLVNELEKMLGGKQARSWICYSGGRVSLCQKWEMLQTNASCTNNLQREAQKRSVFLPHGQRTTKLSSMH
jgi:hypothetical protein